MKILQGLQTISQKQTTLVTVRERPGTVENYLGTVMSKVQFLEKNSYKVFLCKKFQECLESSHWSLESCQLLSKSASRIPGTEGHKS